MTNPIRVQSIDTTLVAAPSGNAIVDGVSDILRIAATGTLTTSGSGTGTAQASVVLATGQTVIPTCLGFLEFFNSSSGQNAGEQTPCLVLNNATGVIVYLYELWAELTSTPGQIRIVAQTTATGAGGGDLAAVYRYYLLQQVAF
jgi:hypothetical protein